MDGGCVKIVDKICVEDNVEIVTIDKLPNEKDTIANVFCIIAQHKINVDMISYLGDCRGEIRVSFSTNKDNIDALINAMKSVKSLYGCAVTNIYGANAKIVLSGDIKSEKGKG